MSNLLLLGGGGHCESVADSLLRMGLYDKIGIVMNEPQPPLFGTIPVVGCDDDLPQLKEEGYDYAFITVGSVGNTRLREKLYLLIASLGFTIPNIIDPSAVVSPHCQLGNGIFIGKNAVVNAGAVIGDAAILNTASVIEHDCRIGEFVHVSPSATLCGNVCVDFGAHIGASSVVIQGKHIGAHTLIGAGTVVIRDIADSQKVVGNPAREIS